MEAWERLSARSSYRIHYRLYIRGVNVHCIETGVAKVNKATILRAFGLLITGGTVVALGIAHLSAGVVAWKVYIPCAVIILGTILVVKNWPK